MPRALQAHNKRQQYQFAEAYRKAKQLVGNVLGRYGGQHASDQVVALAGAAYGNGWVGREEQDEGYGVLRASAYKDFLPRNCSLHCGNRLRPLHHVAASHVRPPAALTVFGRVLHEP